MRNNIDGFTLIELLVVLAILAITLGMGLPALGSVLERTRSANAYHLLTGSLMAARSSAITRRKPVSVCPSADGLRCRKDLAWEDGWIVFLDPDKTGQPANAAAVLNRIDSLGGDLAVRNSSGRLLVRYQTDGRSPGSNVSLRICSRRDASLLGSVIVNNTGRARSERSSGTRPPCPLPI